MGHLWRGLCLVVRAFPQKSPLISPFLPTSTCPNPMQIKQLTEQRQEERRTEVPEDAQVGDKEGRMGGSQACAPSGMGGQTWPWFVDLHRSLSA